MVIISHLNSSCYSAEMSSLSAQMAALEKKHALQGQSAKQSMHVVEHEIQSETSLLNHTAGSIITSLRAPPSSLRSNSNLEEYFRANVESAQAGAAVITPPAEPIQQDGDKAQSNESSAIQREYDMDTWKMYHRIQQARARPEHSTNDEQQAAISSSSVRMVSEERRLSDVSESRRIVSFNECDDDDDVEIFEMEMDS
jgi:hypothetical protein